MNIKTTININKILLKKLDHASNFLNRTRNDIIRSLILHYISNNKAMAYTFSRVKYQKRDPEKNWHTLHVEFQYDIYEKCQDMRRQSKKSVSSIIASAIKKYLKIILNNDEENEIRNPHYINIINKCNNIDSYTVIWGFPEDRILKMLIE